MNDLPNEYQARPNFEGNTAPSEYANSSTREIQYAKLSDLPNE